MNIHLVVKASSGVVVDEYAFTDIGEAENKGDEMRNSKDFKEGEDDVCTVYDVPLKGVVFVLTKADIVGEAENMGIPEERITEEVLETVKQGVSHGLEDCSIVVQTALQIALKEA